jgi:hypothetical protein
VRLNPGQKQDARRQSLCGGSHRKSHSGKHDANGKSHGKSRIYDTKRAIRSLPHCAVNHRLTLQFDADLFQWPWTATTPPRHASVPSL